MQFSHVCVTLNVNLTYVTQWMCARPVIPPITFIPHMQTFFISAFIIVWLALCPKCVVHRQLLIIIWCDQFPDKWCFKCITLSSRPESATADAMCHVYKRYIATNWYKKLCNCRKTTRHTLSVVQNCTKIPFEKAYIGEWHSNALKIISVAAMSINVKNYSLHTLLMATDRKQQIS